MNPAYLLPPPKCQIIVGPCSLLLCVLGTNGEPNGRAVKSAVSKSLNHPTAVSGVGLSPALATCETIQVLLAGVPGGFSRASPVFAHLLIGPSHMR